MDVLQRFFVFLFLPQHLRIKSSGSFGSICGAAGGAVEADGFGVHAGSEGCESSSALMEPWAA
jgi:hypothetical protein